MKGDKQTKKFVLKNFPKYFCPTSQSQKPSYFIKTGAWMNGFLGNSLLFIIIVKSNYLIFYAYIYKIMQSLATWQYFIKKARIKKEKYQS